MKIATVLLSSEPVSMIRKQSGMISVVRRKLMTSDESFFTKAPMTPRDVRRRYSNGLDFEVVFRKGYKKSGMWAEKMRWFSTDFNQENGLPLRNKARVSL